MCNIVLPFNYLGRVFFRSAVLVPVRLCWCRCRSHGRRGRRLLLHCKTNNTCEKLVLPLNIPRAGLVIESGKTAVWQRREPSKTYLGLGFGLGLGLRLGFRLGFFVNFRLSLRGLE